MCTCSLENSRMEIDIPTSHECHFHLPPLIGSHAFTRPTQLSTKSDFISFKSISQTYLTQNDFFPPHLCVEYFLLLPFSFSFRCLKNFHQLWLVKIFSQAVSVLSHACQTAAFDSYYNAWEYLQCVDLCFSWDCHFITSSDVI